MITPRSTFLGTMKWHVIKVITTTGHDLMIHSHEKSGISLVITFLPLTFQLEEVRLLFGFYEEESHRLH